MRRSALLVLGAVALFLPASAVPLAVTTVVNMPPLLRSFTVEINAPTEIPNPPDGKTMAKNSKKLARPQLLPRGTTFRQADYGVNPNATFTTLAPVEGVETSPTPVASAPSAVNSRRSDDSFWEADRLSHDDYDENIAEAAPATVSAPANAPAVASTVTASPSTATKVPLEIADPSTAGPNHLPVSPNAESLSNGAGQATHTIGETRYNASDLVHSFLEVLFGAGSGDSEHVVPNAADFEKTHTDVQKTDRKFAKVVHRRIPAPAQSLTRSAPIRRMIQVVRDVARLVSRHSFEVNTAAILPERPDPTLNMSDPTVAAEEQRRKNMGFLNIDSNKAAPKPHDPPKLSQNLPLNTTKAKVDGAAMNTTTKAV